MPATEEAAQPAIAAPYALFTAHSGMAWWAWCAPVCDVSEVGPPASSLAMCSRRAATSPAQACTGWSWRRGRCKVGKPQEAAGISGQPAAVHSAGSCHAQNNTAHSMHNTAQHGTAQGLTPQLRLCSLGLCEHRSCALNTLPADGRQLLLELQAAAPHAPPPPPRAAAVQPASSRWCSAALACSSSCTSSCDAAPTSAEAQCASSC